MSPPFSWFSIIYFYFLFLVFIVLTIENPGKKERFEVGDGLRFGNEEFDIKAKRCNKQYEI